MASTRTSPRTNQKVELRRPDLRDGAAMWRLAKDSGTLDLNSPYAYLMWADQFAEASVMAEIDGWPAGFVMGFRPPERPRALFVWQVTVADGHRGIGLAGRMIDSLLERLPDVDTIEATVTPSNEASQRLFRGLARRHECECRETPHMRAEHFPTPDHEPEVLFQIGPIGLEQ